MSSRARQKINGASHSKTRSAILTPGRLPRPCSPLDSIESKRRLKPSDHLPHPPKCRMNRRWIAFFQIHISRECHAHRPREATARPSAVPIRLRNWFCGRQARSAPPATIARRFAASGAAMRTANTPDFGTGRGSSPATSPAAKIHSRPTACNVGPTRTNPSSVSANPVSRSQAGGAGCVTQKTKSVNRCSPV